jgi:S1-C subfamily serine protease
MADITTALLSLAIGVSATISIVILADKPENSVIKIEAINALSQTVSSGTGFATKTKSGKIVIISNEHVCNDNEFMYSTHESVTYKLRVIAKSDSADLCMLTAPKYIEPLMIADQLEEDESIRAIGYPYSYYKTTMIGEYKGLITITTLEDIPPNECRNKPNLKLITFDVYDANGTFTQKSICITELKDRQFTTIISAPGGSGSPLLNDDDEVVGVVSMTHSAKLGGPSWAIGENLKELKLFLRGK